MFSHTFSPRENDPIYAQKVQIFYQNIPGGMLPNFIATLVYGGVVWSEVPHLNIVVWGLCNLLSIFARFYLYCRYRQQEESVKNPQAWYLSAAALTCLSGAIWGSAAFFVLPDSALYYLFLAFFIAGFTAAAVAIYSIMLEVVIGFTLLVGTPLFIQFLLHGDSILQGGALIMPVYWIGLIMVSRKVHHAMTTSLKLNVELEEARNTLEARVAERTAALSAANRQLRKLTNAIEQSIEMVVITDLYGKIEFVNPIVEKKTGYAASSLLGQPFQSIQKSGDDTTSLEQVFQKVRIGEHWNGEVVNQTRAGLRYITDMTMTPVCDEDGEITHFVAIMRDITEKKELEQELLQASKLSSIGTLVSGIAHELNTPLATILGFSREIRREADLSPDIKKCADWIVQESERCAVIVRNLLNFSRKNKAETKRFSLNHLVEEILSLYRHQFKTDGIQLKSGLAQLPLFVRGDADQLQQVIVNIIQNARQSIKKTNLKGIIAVKTRLHRPAEQGAKDEVQITIENDGPPIPAGDLEKIFDPFYTTKATGEGTGLGLSISYGIIRAHLGRIRVENRGDVGVRFQIVLPLVKQGLAQAKTDDERVTPADLSLPEGLKILIVEDDEKLRAGLKRLLLRKGAQIIEAANGLEAIDRLEANKVDLILSDFKMAEMDGLEFCRWIEQERPEYLPKFCFLTGIIETPLHNFCGERAIPILMKPVKERQLLETLMRAHG